MHINQSNLLTHIIEHKSFVKIVILGHQDFFNIPPIAYIVILCTRSIYV